MMTQPEQSPGKADGAYLGRRAALAVAGLLTLLSSMSAADDFAALGKLYSDASVRQLVINAAARSTVFLQNPCPSARFSIYKIISPLRPFTLDKSGRIVSGVWSQVVLEQGCGSERRLNVLVSIEAGGTKASFTPMLPGTTHADPVLQKDAVRYAVAALAAVPGAREAHCKIGYVADTEFLQEDKANPVAGARGRPWKERWTFVSCTHKMIVPVNFVPDPTGVTITVPGPEIRIVPLR